MKMNLRKFLAAAIFASFSICAMGAKMAPAPQVEMKTSEGTIIIELYPNKAPVTVANFLQYVREKYYDGLIFHRVIKRFMIQGGGHNPDMTMKPPRAPIINEASNGLKNEAGTIAMARMNAPDSASSQFFISLVNNDALNHVSAENPGYTVFGKVISGFDVVEKIGQTKTGSVGYTSDVPLTPITIDSARVINDKQKLTRKKP